MLKHTTHHSLLMPLLCLGMAVHSLSAKADSELPSTVTSAVEVTPAVEVAPAPAEQVYAMVNGKPITVDEYKILLAATMRQRFYHGNAPESQAEAVRKEVSELLIERALLIEEADRRGIKPDTAMVEQAVADADARYANMPRWQQQREQLLPGLKKQVAQQGQLDQIEKAVRDVPPPADEEVRTYYEQKPELFTEPAKLRLSVILLKVDPSSPKELWEKALEDTQAIYRRIKDGANFAEEARLHSTDHTASNGGDLGYVHRGMLPEALEEKIDKFQVGEVTEPITVLEGVSIFRIEERIEPKLRDFPEVASRAKELLRREQQDQAWRETVNRLREAASIQILLPITADVSKQP